MPTDRRRGAHLGILVLVLLVLAALPAAGSGATASQLTRYPYLTDVVGTSASINFATNQSQSVARVKYGRVGTESCTANVVSATRTSISVASSNQYQWEARLTGLARNARYCYRVFLGPSASEVNLLGTDASPEFLTQPTPGVNTPFTFAVLGDWGETTASGNTHQTNVLQELAASGARFAISSGDIAYPGGSQRNYGDLFQTGTDTSAVFGPSFWKVAGASIPMFPAGGNHGRNDVFQLNWPQTAAASSSGGRFRMDTYCCLNGTSSGTYPSTWYAFDVGTARFYVLDASWSNSNVGNADLYENDYDYHWTPTSAEYRWLEQDLASHSSAVKFAVFHFPLYSAQADEASDTWLQGTNSLEGLLSRYGVDIAFNGHAHIYERNNSSGPNGLISYVTGGGGADIQSISRCSAGSSVPNLVAYAIGWSDSSSSGSNCGSAPRPTSAAQVYHFLKVSVNGSQVTVTPTDSLGRTFDVRTYNFPSDVPPDPDTEPPSRPENLAANVVGGNQVDLSWSASTDNFGVTEYRIYRDGTELATISGDETSYSDTTVSPASNYQYRVSALDEAGNESPQSTAVNASTPGGGLGTPTLVKERTGSVASANALDVAISPANGNTLVAAVAIEAGTSTSVQAITDSGGNTWTKAAEGLITGGTTHVELWYARAANAVNNVHVTLTSSDAAAANVSEWAGIAPSSPLDDAAGQGNSSSTTAATPNVSTSQKNDLVLSAINYGALTGSTLTSAGFTSLSDFGGVSDVHGRAAYRIPNSAGNFSTSWSLGAASKSGAAIAAFRAAWDSNPPAVPQVTATAPTGPANDNNPEVRGTASADTDQVKLYKNDSTCTDPAAAQGTKNSFEGAGISVNVPDNQTTQLRARAVDAAGNASACSAPLAYVEDSNAPNAPQITDTDPDSPANDNNPEVKGSAAADATQIKLYKDDATCTDPAAAQGTKTAFEGGGVTVAVAGDQATVLRARAVDAAGNASPCSTAFAYVEDSTAPAAPQITDTDPDSPANDNNPEVKGSAAADATQVKLYKDDASCSDPAAAQASRAQFVGAGITVAVPDNQNTLLRARAVDAAGNASPCSASITYAEDSSAAAPQITHTTPHSPANDNNPKVDGTAAGDAVTVKIYKDDASCSDPPAAQGSRAEFVGAGIAVSVADDATAQLRARIVDQTGNLSPCSDARDYTEDSTPPETQIDSGPLDGTTVNGPISFTFSSPDSSVTYRCRLDGAPSEHCSSPKDYPGLAEGAHTFKVFAQDLAGNNDATPAQRSFTVDTVAPPAPSLTDTDPDSPANDNNPKVKGTAAGDAVEVRLYKNDPLCVDPAAGQGSKAEFQGAGIALSVADDATAQVRARAVDAAGNVSPCSDVLAYTEDSSAPAAPSLSDTDPDSPANDNNPEVKGSAAADATQIKLYKDDGTCTDPAAAQGTKASFEGAGITVAVADNQTTQLRARAVDAAGNASACSTAFTYKEDSSVPAPQVTDTNPVSPANENNPKARGTSAGDVASVKLYKDDASCVDPPAAQGGRSVFKRRGIAVAVADDRTTELRARAVDVAGNVSSCSDPIAFTEDSTPPETVIEDGPRRNASINGPVSFSFSSPDPEADFRCRMDAAAFEPCSSPKDYPDLAEGAHVFKVYAVDLAGNRDPIPANRPFSVDTIAPAAPSLTDTDPDSPANDNNPEVKGSAAADATQIKLYKDDASCTDPAAAQGTKASFEGAGITVAVADNQTTQLRARAVDAAGNASPCSAPLAYTEDSNAPAAPSLTDTDPDSPANDNNPEVKGSAAADATQIKLYKDDASCTDPAAAQGTKASFEGAGITVAVPDNATTQLRARAADAAGNASACSAPLAYTEDSSAPETQIDIGPLEGSTVTNPVVFAFSSPDLGATFQCQLDTTAPENCSSPETYDSLPEGPHTFKVFATDAAGNSDLTPAERNFSIAVGGGLLAGTNLGASFDPAAALLPIPADQVEDGDENAGAQEEG